MVYRVKKTLGRAKQPATDALKTALKIAIWKTTEENGDLIGNRIIDEITKSQKVDHTIITKQLKMKKKILDLIEKYQEKDL